MPRGKSVADVLGLPVDAAWEFFADEPHVPKALLAMDNVVLLPHVGSGTNETRKAMGDLCKANLDAWFAGKPLMVTYHPSYILRNQSNRSKRMIWEDLLKVMERAALPISDRQRSFFLDK